MIRDFAHFLINFWRNFHQMLKLIFVAFFWELFSLKLVLA
jgi:hypothetical protein